MRWNSKGLNSGECAGKHKCQGFALRRVKLRGKQHITRTVHLLEEEFMKCSYLKSQLMPVAVAALTIGLIGCSSNKAPEQANTAAADNPAPPTPRLSSDDKDFLSTAAKDGYAEIQLAQLALQKARTKGVKDLAQKILDDHQKANSDLAKIATAKGVTLPESTALTDKASEAKLKAYSGIHFDQAYVSNMVDDHKDAITLFQKEAANGSDPDVKQFASSTLSTLQEHLTAAQELENKLKVAKGEKRT
jgi:putative membrane protein